MIFTFSGEAAGMAILFKSAAVPATRRRGRRSQLAGWAMSDAADPAANRREVADLAKAIRAYPETYFLRDDGTSYIALSQPMWHAAHAVTARWAYEDAASAARRAAWPDGE